MPKAFMIRKCLADSDTQGLDANTVVESFNEEFVVKSKLPILNNNQTLYSDKIPICTRFQLGLLRKCDFLPQFRNMVSLAKKKNKEPKRGERQNKEFVEMKTDIKMASFDCNFDMNKTCKICGKVFGRVWVLRGHMRMHSGEKPYSCGFGECKKSFSDRSNLCAHQRSMKHHAWQWSCPECCKPFRESIYLMRHQETACLKYKRNTKAGSAAI